MDLPDYLVTAEEMRSFDAAAINDYGIPGVVLMENAGRATFLMLKERMGGDVAGLKVSVVAGPGNNGGDGYVIARYLINYGAQVRTFLLAPRDKIKGDALINLRVLEMMTEDIFPVTDAESLERAVAFWRHSNVIVDAILGTGLNSEVRSPYRDAIQVINRSNAFKIAVDIPSGVQADTGRILGTCVLADLTATYGFQKLGTALFPGAEYCGEINVVDISIPLHAIKANPPKAILYSKPDPSDYIRLRCDPQAHKGTFGHLLVAGGSPGKTGAPAMAAVAASRVGAGLVTVGIAASLNPILEAKLTEEMTEPLPETVPGYLGEAAAERLLALAQGMSCMVLGPGISTLHGVPQLVRRILADYTGWVVIDADGLNALAQDMEILRTTRARLVLTPHPGEMGRLTGTSSREVQQDRVTLARETAQDYGVWLILKGARTVIASPGGQIWVNTSGNPWMASGGQGDALSGIVGGLLVQRIEPEQAIPFGVYLHGLAADEILERSGRRPVLATDVIGEIPRLLAGLVKDNL